MLLFSGEFLFLSVSARRSCLCGVSLAVCDIFRVVAARAPVGGKAISDLDGGLAAVVVPSLSVSCRWSWRRC